MVLRVIVDADACPKSCLAIIQSMADEYSYQVITVASFNHRINNPEHRVVGDESQAADLAIANLASLNDIVVTQDWGLAALALAKQAKAISPGGRIFGAAEIQSLLEERAIAAKYRRSGGRTKGPAPRSRSDDHHFTVNFRKLLLS